MCKINETTSINELAEKSSKLANDVISKMCELGVRRLANVYISNQQSNAHGEQTRLHIDGDERQADLTCRRIENSNDYSYDFGDFNLPYLPPDLEAVFEFLKSVDDINNAISEINIKVSNAL